MPLADHYQNRNRIAISFELFPPKTEKGEKKLHEHVQRLMRYQPDFITCTYGAGGSTRDKTLDIVTTVKRNASVPVASHLTLVGSTVDDLRHYLARARDADVDYIVALRGDPPKGQDSFTQTAGGFRFANELVELIHAEFSNFGVAVAGYPETHREAPDWESDLVNLKRKVDAGADVVITQLFYDNSDYFRFRDRCEAAGIDVPIVPGLLPVTNLGQVQRIASLCGSRLPAPFEQRLAEREDPDWQFQVGLEFAVQQTRELVEGGVPGLHFYVLNKSDITSQILDGIELNPVSGS